MHFHPIDTPTLASLPPTPILLAQPPSHPRPAPQPISLLHLPHLSLLLTGSSDEHLRVYDLAPGEASARFVRLVEGHCADVISLRRWFRSDGNEKGEWVVSASLDGTLRRWRLADLLVVPAPPEPGTGDQGTDNKTDNGGMTEEELRELEELMGDD